MNIPNSEPDGDGKSVDETPEKDAASRAREGGQIGPISAEVLARTVETDTRFHQGEWSLRDVINAFPMMRVLMVAEAVRGLGAVIQCWNATLKAYEEKPDYGTRQKWATWIAAYGDGRPIETSVHVNGTPNRKQTESSDMSPAMIEAAERAIALAKKKNAEKQALNV